MMNNAKKAEAISDLTKEIFSIEEEIARHQKQLDAIDLKGNQELFIRLGQSENYAGLKIIKSSLGWLSVVRGREMIALGVKKVLQATIDQKNEIVKEKLEAIRKLSS